MESNVSRRRWLVTFALLAAVVLASCGQPTAQAPVGQATQPAAACEIKMGLLFSLTGDLGDIAQAQLPAEEIAVEEINAAGGPLGCKVVVLTEDDESSAQGAVAGANKLVFTNGVITIIGLNSSGITALLDFARTNKLPVLTHYGGTVKLDTEGGDYVFRTVLSDSFAGIGSAKFLTDMGFKTAANFYENSESPQSNAVTMKREFEKMGGKVVVDVAFNPGQSSYQAELKKVFDAKPEIVLLAAGQDSGATILKEWYRGNYGGQWLLGSDLAASEFVAQVGPEIMTGMYGQTSGDDVSSPSYKRFQELWKQKTGEDTIAPWASNLYDSFILEALAIEIGGAATGEVINANMKKVTTGEVQCLSFQECLTALREGKTIQYMGVSGPLQFNKYNNVVAPYTMLITEGDHWKVFKFYSADNFKLTD
jgi:branched-chain amino acid transport system substrate-binding protein